MNTRFTWSIKLGNSWTFVPAVQPMSFNLTFLSELFLTVTIVTIIEVLKKSLLIDIYILRLPIIVVGSFSSAFCLHLCFYLGFYNFSFFIVFIHNSTHPVILKLSVSIKRWTVFYFVCPCSSAWLLDCGFFKIGPSQKVNMLSMVLIYIFLWTDVKKEYIFKFYFCQ